MLLRPPVKSEDACRNRRLHRPPLDTITTLAGRTPHTQLAYIASSTDITGTQAFYGLHIESTLVIGVDVADHISAAEVGAYVQRSKEPFGRRSSPSLECGLLPGLRGH